jgi:hypothetical protein
VVVVVVVVVVIILVDSSCYDGMKKAYTTRMLNENGERLAVCYTNVQHIVRR